MICRINVAISTAIFALALGGEPVTAHAPMLLVRVLDSTSGQALPNAEVIDFSSGIDRFTDQRGQTRLLWPPNGQLRIRVRQIGFRFVDREVSRDTSVSHDVDTITFALPRVRYVLPDVVIAGSSHCVADVDSASKLLSIAVLEQLRLSAERYEIFRRTYPFHLTVLRRTADVGHDGRAKRIQERTEEAESEQWTEHYTPGRVVERKGRGFSIPVLFLESLADPQFWDHHCFVVRGVESKDSSRTVRMEFSVDASVKGADWEGSVLVDSATSLLKRVDFKLTGLRDDDLPRRYEGYTTFVSPSPFIVMPESTLAIWWRQRGPVDGKWGQPDAAQLLHVRSVIYRKSAPPGNQASPP
ncbi:MAG: hypothetical protein M3081_21675 [Gemmatimonadota bacterium]|nr:hypothetical protein [Gemmatimonadota bacterium]